jgi:hypothetical protein
MKGPRVVDPAPKIPSGEPIVPPPLVSTILPLPCLILAGEVARPSSSIQLVKIRMLRVLPQVAYWFHDQGGSMLFPQS